MDTRTTAKKKVACKRQKLITAKIPTSLITDKIPTIFTNFGPYYRLSVISYYRLSTDVKDIFLSFSS